MCINLQLNIYAKFTNQMSVQRSNTFARAVCAGELYEVYYSGGSADIDYMFSGATIIGPLLLIIVVVLICGINMCNRGVENGNYHNNIKDKKMVALVCVGIYVSIYIVILDVWALYIILTSSHEYELELAGRH